MDRGVPIRSISRCITVLQAINRQGSLSLMEVARTSKLPYPTACRIIQTLIHEGLVECEPARKCYRATGLVHSLSRGFDNRDRLVTGARPFIVALTRKLGWPVIVTTRVGQSMMVRDTTHDLTALTTDLDPPGYTMPLLDSPAGQVYLAHLVDGERDDLIAVLQRGNHGAHPDLTALLASLARIREDGHAVFERDEPHVADPERTASISVPLLDGGRPAGVLTLVFFSAVIAVPDALARYRVDLEATAAAIGDAMGNATDPTRPGTKPAKARDDVAPFRAASITP